MLTHIPLEWTVEEVAPYLERLAVWLRASVLVAFQLIATAVLGVLGWSLAPQVAGRCEPPLSHLSLAVPASCLLLLLRGPPLDHCPRKLPLLLACCLPHALAFLGLVVCQPPPPPRALSSAAGLTLLVGACCLGAALLSHGYCGGPRESERLRRLLSPVLSLLCATAPGLWLLRAAPPFFLGLHAVALLTTALALTHDLSLITFRSTFPESFQPSLRLYVENVALFIGVYHLLTPSRWWPAAV